MSSNLVQIDVSVLGQDGRPVRGLPAVAFHLFQRGATEGDGFALISFSDRRTSDTARSTASSRPVRVSRKLGLKRRAHNQRRVILVLSDGGDNRSRYREAEVRRLLLETPAQVYAVSIAQFFQDESTAFGPDLLDRLCYVSGGRNVAIDGRVDLDREMTRVNDEIRAEYVLAYSPDRMMRDGKFHRVAFRLARPPGVKPVSMSWRLGYYDPLE